MNVSKLPARRIGRSRKTQTKELCQTVSDFRSTVFENRRDSIRTVILLRKKAREGLKHVIMKNFKYRDKIVRGWSSRRHMASIFQSRIDSKGLSVEFSFKKR